MYQDLTSSLWLVLTSSELIYGERELIGATKLVTCLRSNPERLPSLERFELFHCFTCKGVVN
ncbi:hypothetical protein WN51_11563 [Melipona quadrifasciata]|uniref:Uncharacterized protein n=1 Tax=Melipona quadrifasciata TaxID=166423 RepID=A0A0N0BHG7_9HYME|nr:hypothetical protein WN51_11563 [Melipona quadrifasciata]